MTPAFISKAKPSKVKQYFHIFFLHFSLIFQLHLKVDSVPDDPTSKYSCSFGLSSLLTETETNDTDKLLYKSNAIKYENFLECYSPPPDTLSNINQSRILINSLTFSFFYNI
jgi:hypothetical protein